MFKFLARTHIVESDDFVTTVLEICRDEKARMIGLLLDPHVTSQPDVQRLETALGVAGIL